MPRITDIVYKSDRERYWVHVDGKFCATIRARTFQAMNLNIGDEITCDELKERENFFWKQQYSGKWEDEKIRLEKVKNLITEHTRNIKIETTGFGADSNEIIKEHPEEHGEPDLTLKSNNNQQVRMILEVTGTKTMRGNDYWVRPDKLEYAQSHPDDNVWIALHYAEPSEKFIFIKPDLNKKYGYVTKSINDAGEHYVTFDDNSDEVFTKEQFVNIISNQDFDR